MAGNKPVIDACVAIKWFIPEKNYERAGAILRSHYSMIVPDLFFIEMDAIIIKKIRKKQIEAADSLKIYNEIRNIPFEVVPYPLISKMAFDLSSALPVTQYDACYLAAALEYNEKVYTADMRFVKGMKGTPFERYVEPV